MRKLGAFRGETLHLSSSRWLLLFERKSQICLYMSEQMNSQRTWQYFNKGSGHSPVFGHLHSYTTKPRTTPAVHWNPTPLPLPFPPFALTPVVEVSRSVSSLFNMLNLSDCSCLFKMNHASNAAWKEKTFVIKLSLRLSSRVFPPWPKNKTLASVEYHLGLVVAGRFSKH